MPKFELIFLRLFDTFISPTTVDEVPWVKFEFGKCMAVIEIVVRNREYAGIEERILGTEVSLTMFGQDIRTCGHIGRLGIVSSLVIPSPTTRPCRVG